MALEGLVAILKFSKQLISVVFELLEPSSDAKGGKRGTQMQVKSRRFQEKRHRKNGSLCRIHDELTRVVPKNCFTD